MERQISERDFLENEERRLRELADKITQVMEDWEMSCSMIARECNMEPRTVRRARRGIALRADSTERIEYFIRQRGIARESNKKGNYGE